MRKRDNLVKSKFFKFERRIKEMKRVKFCLDEKEMPTAWYNILADLPEPLPPPLHAATGKP